MKKHTITIFGSRVSYWVYNPGQPTTIVMIHGFRGTHHGLQQIIDHLPGVRIIVPDLPGFDASTPMTERKHDVKGYRDFTEAFIDKLALKKPILLGHSFGTIVVAAAVAHRPKLVKKLIMINTIAAPTRDAAFSWAAELYYWLGRRLPEKASRRLLSSKAIIDMMSTMLAKTRDKDLRRDIHAKHLTHFSTYRDREALYQAFKAGISHTATQYAQDITVPTLLIAGELDEIAPPKGQQELLDKLPDAQLKLLDNVGHLIHYEKPVEAAEAIQDFVQT